VTSDIDARLAAAGLPPLPRRVWLEIDTDALAENLRALRELVGPDVELNAVVKADAYGHGLVPVARVFADAGADRLCVASLDEALALRGAGLRTPILVLFPIPAAAVARAAQLGVEIVAAEATSTSEALGRWSAEAASGRLAPDVELRVHLEVETGLSRGGVKPESVVELARLILETPRATLAGLWSHLATPEREDPTRRQEDAFARAITALGNAGLPVPPRHLSATGGLLTEWAAAYEGIRPGLSLYGIVPDALPVPPREREVAQRLRPAMTLKCTALRIERFPAGTPVGYGGRWVASRESEIATLPVGYGDGWSRSYTPGAQALVRGVRVPLVGTVAMDAVMADVTDVGDVRLDDEFVLLGSQGGQTIDANELARLRNTIPWEVVTSMAHRIPRVYHAGSVLLATRTLDGESRGQAVEAVA
jgi:alanine racemase